MTDLEVAALDVPQVREPRTNDIIKEFQPTTDRDFLAVLGSTALNFEKQCATPLGQDAALGTTHALIDIAMRRFRDGATEPGQELTARIIVHQHPA
ncbi:hypothetical protein [Streptomyces lydicus]|uniref:hypothetical protein n=1 Tax=Streptomyces lydicus TaxID=47763 RepID=UPI0013E2D981|nr:hypothetical protein [Streptomyces lydicus]